MSTFTENYDLIKPEETDFYNVSTFNENMDTLDELIAANEAEVAALGEKIGTPATEGSTIFSLLEGSGGGVIKSIQKVTFSTNSNSGTHTKTLETTVDPDKCVVLLDKLHDRTSIMKLAYTLTANSISFTPTYDNGDYAITVLFQIIEFY